MRNMIAALFGLLLLAGVVSAASVWVGGIRLTVPDAKVSGQVAASLSSSNEAIFLELTKGEDSNGRFWGQDYWNFVCWQPSNSLAFFTGLSGGWVVGQNCLEIPK